MIIWQFRKRENLLTESKYVYILSHSFPPISTCKLDTYEGMSETHLLAQITHIYLDNR